MKKTIFYNVRDFYGLFLRLPGLLILPLRNGFPSLLSGTGSSHFFRKVLIFLKGPQACSAGFLNEKVTKESRLPNICSDSLNKSLTLNPSRGNVSALLKVPATLLRIASAVLFKRKNNKIYLTFFEDSIAFLLPSRTPFSRFPPNFQRPVLLGGSAMGLCNVDLQGGDFRQERNFEFNRSTIGNGFSSASKSALSVAAMKERVEAFAFKASGAAESFWLLFAEKSNKPSRRRMRRTNCDSKNKKFKLTAYLSQCIETRRLPQPPKLAAKASGFAMTRWVGVGVWMKALWSGYQDRQKYRKEVQRRLLKQRALKRERALTPLGLRDEHWTDRLLKIGRKEQGVRIKEGWKAEGLITNRSPRRPNPVAHAPLLAMTLKIEMTVLLIGCAAMLKAQDTIRPLKVGDKIPAAIFNLLQKHENEIGKNLSNKLLIIDFWSTTCGTCIKKLPEIDSLNQVFKEQISIIPITSDASTRVNKFLGINPMVKNLKIHSINQDTLLKRLFPYRFLPHEVWIDAKGTYLGATESEYVNASTIRQVLAGKSLLDAKEDLIDFDLRTTALHQHFPHTYKGAGWLGPYISGLRYGSARVAEATQDRYYVSNASILQLYALAIQSSGYPFNPKRRIIGAALLDEVDYRPALGYQKKWEERHSYWYELPLQSHSADTIRRQKMLADLNQAFGLKGELVVITDTIMLMHYQKPEKLTPPLGKLSIQQLLWELAQLTAAPLIINKITEKLSPQFYLPIHYQTLPFSELRNVLAQQGILLQSTTQSIQKFKLIKTKP